MRLLYIQNVRKETESPVCSFQRGPGEYHLEVVAGASEALALMEQRESDPFDLAVIDESVPDDEWVQLIDHVREGRLRVAVMVSADSSEEIRIRAESNAEAGGYTIRPVGGPAVVAGVGLIARLGDAARNQPEESIVASAMTLGCQLLETIIKSLSARVVVLDRNGVIAYESKSWPQMAPSGSSDPGWNPVGANYLEVCRRVAADGDEYARLALKGVESVLAGDIPSFGLEYSCDLSGRRAWCLMQVDAMPPEHGGVVISHTDITSLKQAEDSLRNALSDLEQLKNQLQQENVYLQEEIKFEHYSGEIIGESPALRQVLHKVDQVAATDTTVLILGETGTGKELVARAIHSASPRKDRPLVKVNCAALPSTLIESELFGHEKGAFTGAQARKVGRFELASGGTLMLDEIGELPPELQAKLLRVLQEGEFERLGSSNTMKLNVRVIAATNRDLRQDVQEGRFRADLWYRLNVFPITMPPLRDRGEDIPLLVHHFANKFSKKIGKRFTAISPAAVRELESYRWPGNVRELASVIERAVIVSPGPVLALADKLTTTPEVSVPSAARRTLEEIERESILNRLEETGWKIDGKGGAAESLGINPSTLRSRMIKLGIRAPQKQYAPSRL